MPGKIILEIAVDSLQDAVEAVEAGADRLELVADLKSHGLTPPPALVERVKAAVHVPVVAMVRPDAGPFTADPRLVARLLNQAEDVLAAGADGLVFGALTPQAHADREAVAMLVQAAAGKQTVFHRAFDLTPDPLGTIGTLIDRGVTRVLTSGLDARATAAALAIEDAPAPSAVGASLTIRLRRIRCCVEAAAGRIEIMPGGGVRSGNAAEVLRVTGATQLHASCRIGDALSTVEVRALRRAADEYAENQHEPG